jgi:hypothetical protein
MYLAADALSARRGPAMSRGDDSVIRDRATEGEAWLKIDTATARVLCVSALVMLAAAVAGCYLLSVLGELNVRLDKLQTQRLTQLDDYRAAILGLESKLEAVAIKLQRVEALTQPNNWDADARSQRLQRLEHEIAQNGSPQRSGMAGSACVRRVKEIRTYGEHE